MAEILFTPGNVPQTDLRDQPIGVSALGTPVYQRVTFQSGSYPTKVQGQNKTWEQIDLDTCVIVVNQAKKIIRTEIQGRDGTVKEYVGMDDYQVQISGMLAGANGQRPVDQVIALKKMLDAPVPIQVACQYLQDLGITDLVVESYVLDQQPGGHSYQTFSINFISDTPVELRISE